MKKVEHGSRVRTIPWGARAAQALTARALAVALAGLRPGMVITRLARPSFSGSAHRDAPGFVYRYCRPSECGPKVVLVELIKDAFI